MAINGTDRGVVTHNTSSGTFVCAPTSTIPAGSAGVLKISIDNTGSGGNTAICPASVVDSVGNTWTRRISAFQDPGAAGAGVEIAVYVCEILSTQLTSSNNVTLTLGANATAKVATFDEVTPTAGMHIAYVTGATGSANTANPSITTGTITNGNMVIGFTGTESSGTFTGDSDTTNGSWSTQQTTVAGSGTSAQSISSQRKVVTATATQTYNVTLAAADRVIGWIELTEVPAGHPAFRRFGLSKFTPGSPQPYFPKGVILF